MQVEFRIGVIRQLIHFAVQKNHNKLWKILKAMGISDHLTCLLPNLYAGQEATVRTKHGRTTDSKLGKKYIKAVYCHPAYLTCMQSTPCKNAMLDEAQAGFKIAERNINNLRQVDDATLMAESEEELKSLLMKVKRRVKNLALSSTVKKLRSWYPVLSLHGKQMGKKWKQRQSFFSWAPKSLQ